MFCLWKLEGLSIAINSLVCLKFILTAGEKSSKDVKLYLLVDSATSVDTKITENTAGYYSEHSWSSYFVRNKKEEQPVFLFTVSDNCNCDLI